ncbi:hypothetical protein JJD41_02125 [Oxynema sp. CENA135]|uniref:hypothetical protein n=1 Tax=Oxynema sp. CENA135 TaxID=984206 RepID=UPI00190D45F3|nr:hypothetical protein [Oxynema sp. CENA135]MBK4728687.1 hypothetical protein [Oxynema sp. CENA135]
MMTYKHLYQKIFKIETQAIYIGYNGIFFKHNFQAEDLQKPDRTPIRSMQLITENPRSPTILTPSCPYLARAFRFAP